MRTSSAEGGVDVGSATPARSAGDPGESVTLGFVLQAIGATVISLRVAPKGTTLPVRSVTLLDVDDLEVAEELGGVGPGVPVADLCVLAGVPSASALAWLARLGGARSVRPVAVVIKDPSPELCRAADGFGIAIGALHAQARAEMVLSTVRSLLEGAAARPRPGGRSAAPVAEESDLYALAQRVAALTSGLVSIEDDQSRLLAYSATDGAADELRMLSILGREGPADHLRRLRELGVFDRLRRQTSVIEVPADDQLGWRRRLAVSIQPIGAADGGRAAARSPLGTIWVQEGWQPLDPDATAVLEGAAAIAARLIHRARNAPTQEAIQIQRLLGLRGGGVDVPSLAAALALPTSGPSAVIGVSTAQVAPVDTTTAEITAALRLHAGAFARDSLVTADAARIYVLIPRLRSGGLDTWLDGVLDRLTVRLGPPLRAAIAAPVATLEEVPAARAEVDRVLDRPAGEQRVTTFTQSRTPVLLGEIAELVGSRIELRDPRLQALIDYDRGREASLVESVERYLHHFADVRGAAAELHVHPNTLRYRVRRAEEVLGMSLADPDARLLLQIQLLAIRHTS